MGRWLGYPTRRRPNNTDDQQPGRSPSWKCFWSRKSKWARTSRRDRGKRQRPNGPPASSPAVVADQTGRLLAEREREWLERLTTDPASFAAVELEVHEQARRQADLYVAGLLAKASEQA